jgi:putative ABC transport system substrate-binding protein
MKRRRFVALAAAAIACPRAALAQRATLPFIGFLNVGGPNERMHLVEAFRRGLKEGGYVDGKDVAIEYRWAEGRYERLPAFAKELVDRQVKVLVATGGPAPALAAKAATVTIPIVFTGGGDPVELGLVQSHSRPGGNLTGIYNVATSLDAKRFEILRDLLPTGARIAYLINPAGPNAKHSHKVYAALNAPRKQLDIINASTEMEIDAAFATAKKTGVGGLLVGNDAVFLTRREQIVALADRHGLPAIYPFREFIRAGGLISYGADLRDIYRQAGLYAARVLKGAKPAELPVVQASKFEMLLNLKAARKIGLTISRDFLARVDEVIE